MSLIKKEENKSVVIERTELKTESEFKKEQLEKGKEYQKQNRKAHLGSYQEQKSVIDELDQAGLEQYIATTAKSAHDTRVGNFNVKINPHEFALVKLAVIKAGARSARDLLFKLIDEAGLTEPDQK